MQALKRYAAVRPLAGCVGTLFVAIVALGSAQTWAAENPSKECRILVGRVADAVGRNFDRQDQVKNTFFFKLPKDAEIQVRCQSPANKATVVYMRADADLPQRSFYDTLAKVGASVSGRPVRDVRKWAHRCHRIAKRVPTGRAERGRHGLTLECRRSEERSVFLIKGPFSHES
jgi:hypothetical protein